MRRLDMRTGWLGWAVAGVLLVAAGGAALAAQDATTTTHDQTARADKLRARVGALGGGRWGHGLGRRVLHGEMTVQTKESVKTVVVARGEVTSVSATGITVKSSDNVSTTFRIDGDTRYGFRNEPAQRAELKVGDTAFVVGEKSGDSAVAKRVVSGELERPGTGKGATP